MAIPWELKDTDTTVQLARILHTIIGRMFQLAGMAWEVQVLLSTAVPKPFLPV